MVGHGGEPCRIVDRRKVCWFNLPTAASVPSRVYVPQESDPDRFLLVSCRRDPSRSISPVRSRSKGSTELASSQRPGTFHDPEIHVLIGARKWRRAIIVQ
jgi:hypothetical protein